MIEKEVNIENLKPHSKTIRLFYFLTGIIATVAYRIIIVLTGVSSFWIKTAWYIGTIGFVVYFIHRFQISEQRKHTIAEYHLDEKVNNLTELNEDEKKAMHFVFKSLEVSSEKWIYIIIFITSGLALLAGIYLDFK